MERGSDTNRRPAIINPGTPVSALRAGANMRILAISQYFPPEIGATQTRAYEMARGLIRAGHQVTMLTEVPNHPQGVIHPAYRGRLYVREETDGIDVRRLWVSASPQKTTRTRMAFYLSFMFGATLAGLFMARGHYDVVYASSPPLFVGGAALAISYLRRVPLVFEVRDLWPESAVQLGELNNPRAVRLATRLEETCYRRARHIVVVTHNIRGRLVERGYSAAKIIVIPNGANTQLYCPQPINQALRQQLGIRPDQFVVIYTGLHGLAHGLETALQAADLLREHEDILFLFVGDGPRKADLMDMAGQMGLDNVCFHEAVPEPELPAYIALADVGLDTRRRIGISQGTLPVKMFSYMACERPVLLSIEGEAVQLLERAGAGVAVPPETPEALARAILDLQDDPAERAAFGCNGRAFVEAHYSRQGFAHQLEDLLSAVVSDRRSLKEAR
jgi:colanic acid biosynthesis glycosyl transferase WcaI